MIGNFFFFWPPKQTQLESTWVGRKEQFVSQRASELGKQPAHNLPAGDFHLTFRCQGAWLCRVSPHVEVSCFRLRSAELKQQQ